MTRYALSFDKPRDLEPSDVWLKAKATHIVCGECKRYDLRPREKCSCQINVSDVSWTRTNVSLVCAVV